jgi:hypothetical protein
LSQLSEEVMYEYTLAGLYDLDLKEDYNFLLETRNSLT